MKSKITHRKNLHNTPSVTIPNGTRQPFPKLSILRSVTITKTIMPKTFAANMADATAASSSGFVPDMADTPLRVLRHWLWLCFGAYVATARVTLHILQTARTSLLIGFRRATCRRPRCTFFGCKSLHDDRHRELIEFEEIPGNAGRSRIDDAAVASMMQQ